jgi:hypothetical protein
VDASRAERKWGLGRVDNTSTTPNSQGQGNRFGTHAPETPPAIRPRRVTGSSGRTPRERRARCPLERTECQTGQDAAGDPCNRSPTHDRNPLCVVDLRARTSFRSRVCTGPRRSGSPGTFRCSGTAHAVDLASASPWPPLPQPIASRHNRWLGGPSFVCQPVAVRPHRLEPHLATQSHRIKP